MLTIIVHNYLVFTMFIYCSKCCICINSFKPYKIPMWQVLLIVQPFYRWKNHIMERLKYLPEIAQGMVDLGFKSMLCTSSLEQHLPALQAVKYTAH